MLPLVVVDCMTVVVELWPPKGDKVFFLTTAHQNKGRASLRQSAASQRTLWSDSHRFHPWQWRVEAELNTERFCTDGRHNTVECGRWWRWWLWHCLFCVALKRPQRFNLMRWHAARATAPQHKQKNPDGNLLFFHRKHSTLPFSNSHCCASSHRCHVSFFWCAWIIHHCSLSALVVRCMIKRQWRERLGSLGGTGLVFYACSQACVLCKVRRRSRLAASLQHPLAWQLLSLCHRTLPLLSLPLPQQFPGLQEKPYIMSL